MTESWTWSIEAYLSGAWVNISDDVLRHETISAERGMQGNDVVDRVAAPGTFSFALDNSKANSAGLLGYYSPDHASLRTGFGLNTPVRLKFVYGATTKYWIKAWIDDIDPPPGQFREQITRVSSSDYMRWLQRELERLPVQLNKRPDQLIDTAIDAVPTVPANTSYDVDPTTWPIGFHLERDEKTQYMGLMQAICKSSLGYFFLIGNATDGETLVYQNRHNRTLKAVEATLDNTMSRMVTSRKISHYRNSVKGTIFPVEIDAAATTVLAAITNEFSLNPGETREISLRVRDPAGQAQRISGDEYVEPLVANTHFRMSSISLDGGNDLNANLSITGDPGATGDFGANTIRLYVENTHATAIGHVNKLEVQGKGIYPYDPIDLTEQSGAADISMTYSMPYQSDINVGRDFVMAVHRWVSAAVTQIDEVWFYPDFNSTLMGYFINVEIGDRVVLKEEATGIYHEYYVNRLMLRIEHGGKLSVGWKVVLADTVNFFILNDTVYGVLDDTDISLAF